MRAVEAGKGSIVYPPEGKEGLEKGAKIFFDGLLFAIAIKMTLNPPSL